MNPVLVAEALRRAQEALIHVERSCRYHGTDFLRLGTEPFERGLPRCDSCKTPYRRKRALDAIDAAVRSQLPGEVPE